MLQFILLIAIRYSRGENKKNNCLKNYLIKSTLHLLILRQNSISFEGSPEGPGGVLIHRWIRTGECQV